MQKIIESRSPSRQLLETVNFAFMKIFDSLVKIAFFRASLLFWEICIMLYGRNRTSDPGSLEEMHDVNLLIKGEMP